MVKISSVMLSSLNLKINLSHTIDALYIMLCKASNYKILRHLHNALGKTIL